MSVAAPVPLPPTAAHRRAVRQTSAASRALVWLPSLAAAGAVSVYCWNHRQLVLAPGRDLLAAFAGAGDPEWRVLASFAALLLVPAALVGALAASLWRWCRLYDRRPTPRLLATLVAVSATLVAVQVALAAAGRLRPEPLAVSLAAVAAALAVGDGLRRRRAGEPPSPAAGTGRLAGGGPLARAAARLDLAPPTRLGLLLGALAATAWAAVTAAAALVPPWGWDTLVYHLTDVFHFAASGRLEPFPHPLQQFHFPKVGELHSLAAYLLAGGGEEAWRVTGIAQLPLALTAGVAVRFAAETLGLRAALPWLVPAVVLTPLALVQPAAGYVDLAFAAFLVAAVAFVLAALRRDRTADWGFAALAAGLALGTKLSFLYLGAPVLVLLALRRPRPGGLRPGRLLARGTLCLALATVGCGFWLLPALARTGNPLYPVAVRLGGVTLADGPVEIGGGSHRERFTPDLAGWLGYPLRESFLGRVAYTPDNGFGPQFAAAYLALPFAVLLAWRRRQRLLVRALLAAPAVAIAWLAISPWEHPRYALPACGLALLALAAVEEAAVAGRRASRAARGLLRAALAVALLFAAAAGPLAAAPELAAAVAAWRTGDGDPRDHYRRIYGAAGDAFTWLDESGGATTTVSFDRATFVAPLFGWHGRHRVVYAASPSDRDLPGVPRAATYRDWRRFLADERVDWVVSWHEWWLDEAPPSVRERWIQHDPDGFAEVAGFGPAARVLAPRGGVPPPAPRFGPRPALARAGDWRLDYATGAQVEIAADPTGGLRLDYRFLTAEPDYLDLRLELEEGSWPADGRLEFTLDTPGGSPLLFVYLKQSDQRRSARFRIPPRPPSAEPAAIGLPLGAPEAASPGFDPSRLAAIHLVLDDGGAGRPSTGSFRLRDFRLAPARAAGNAEPERGGPS